MFHGRRDELAAIGALLDAARTGRGGALVVRGEAGIGKTALLDHVAETAPAARVLRGAGIESEAELPYAGLHLLLREAVHRAAALPEEQARALDRAFGGAPAGGGGDRFLVGTAVLGLLGGMGGQAAERPLLCLVDDAHWLDPASAGALLFAARRLDAAGVAVVLAVREPHAPDLPTPGVPELRLGGLADADAERLLAAHAGDLPEPARAEILRESRGNPLALRELPAVRRTGLVYDPGTPPVRNRVQRAFAERIAALPAPTRTLLLVAAAAGSAEPGVTLDAAARLGASLADLGPAERADLLRLDGGRLAFRHPLVQAAAYQEAAPDRRLAAHRALAEVLAADHGRRAWHLAAACTGPDEDVAAALERSVDDARRRGGYTAAVAAHERAAALTPDPYRRGRRLISAAKVAADAGRLRHAAELAGRAAARLTDPVELAQVARLDALLARDGRHAHRSLIGAARAISGQAPDVAGHLLFCAIEHAWSAGDFPAVADAARGAELLDPPDSEPARDLARAASGLGASATDGSATGGPATDGPATGGVAEGVAALRRLVARMDGYEGTPRKRAMVAWWHVLLGDFRTVRGLATALERTCRAEGAIGLLPDALALSAVADLHFGNHRDALAGAGEGLLIARDTGSPHEAGAFLTVLAHVAAIEGDEPRCLALLAEADGLPAVRARNLLDLAAGRAEQILGRPPGLAGRVDARTALPDVVEAAVRAGRPEAARAPLAAYTDWATRVGQPWAEAIAFRCRALLGDGDAEAHYAKAMRLHRESGEAPFEHARTELLQGEWLRRAHRRTEARAALRSALATFERLRARPWADRARAELRASGESRPTGGAANLTPQETQVVRFAATGLSNKDIAARLFLSPRTVGYHLSNAYPKLGVASRSELTGLNLPDSDQWDDGGSTGTGRGTLG